MASLARGRGHDDHEEAQVAVSLVCARISGAFSVNSTSLLVASCSSRYAKFPHSIPMYQAI